MLKYSTSVLETVTSFDSDSSSSGTKDNKERVECDSSPETPELNNSLETETDYTRKNKKSMCRMLKRMLTRQMRRNKSDDCSTNIPAHALFQPSAKIKNGQSRNIHKKTSLKMRKGPSDLVNRKWETKKIVFCHDFYIEEAFHVSST
jgi:hypothetical protein